jgi:hypothetical protein
MKIEAHRKIVLVAILALLLIPFPADDASGASSVKVSKLTAGSDTGSLKKKFGHSIAVSGDTMVFGAPDDDAAYVFEYDGSNWSQVAKLTPNGGTIFNIYFGYSVAISGDTVVVGAPLDLYFVGAAYVFKREGGTWNEVPETKLTASDLMPYSFALFGYSLAFEGGTLLVGVPNVNTTYVYSPEGAKWPEEETRLTASDAESGDRFGWAVAISGARAVVGAPRDESTVGSAYVFDFDGAGWLETAKLTASDKADYDDFGFSVAIHQDTVVVGAHKDSSFLKPPAAIYGAAYVFEFDGNSWLEEAKLTASEPEDYDQFGYSVAIKESTLLVGAPVDPDNNEEFKPGAAYVFETDGKIWSEKLKLTASEANDPPEKDQFGFSVAINGTNLVVGAILADAEIQDAGAAYVFVDNEPPVAVASWDPQEGIVEGDLVTLDGSGSEDPDGDPLIYNWVQTGGPKVDLDLVLAANDKTNPAVRKFVAPELSDGCDTLIFQLTVTEDFDGGLTSDPVTVKIEVLPNNTIHSKLVRKHRHWLYWHKYTFEGVKDQVVTLNLQADPDGLSRGERATLILKDKIRRVRLYKKDRGELPNTVTATLPADGKYVVYVVKQPWFCRGKNFRGDYILTLEGTCGKLKRTSRFWDR